jgi:hypothetical protein
VLGPFVGFFVVVGFGSSAGFGLVSVVGSVCNGCFPVSCYLIEKLVFRKANFVFMLKRFITRG